MIEIKVLASGSGGNAYYVSDGVTAILIEAGIPYSDIQEGLWGIGTDVPSLGGCLISHSHGDHAKAVPHLLKHAVDCYMSLDTARELKVANHHRVYFEGNAGFWIVGSWTIQPFPAVHDIPCLGFLLYSSHTGERLVYLSDSAYSEYKFPGVTHYILGCNYDLDILNENIELGRVHGATKSRLMHSHASLETVKEMLRKNDLSKLKEVWLIHLSSRNSDEERFKREIQEIAGVPVYVAGE